MKKRLTKIGNSAGIILDRPILQLLNIDSETQLELTTDGQSLTITPVRSPDAEMEEFARLQKKILEDHGDTFRKLAE